MESDRPIIEQAEFNLFCEKQGLAVTEEQATSLRSYLELLLKWNACTAGKA